MKKNNPAAIILFAFALLFNLQLFAQKRTAQVPDKGYWVIVTNKHEKKVVTVQFYNDDNHLMYQERLVNTKLNLERKKVRRQLNEALVETYQTWAITNAEPAAKDFLAKRLKN